MLDWLGRGEKWFLMCLLEKCWCVLLLASFLLSNLYFTRRPGRFKLSESGFVVVICGLIRAVKGDVMTAPSCQLRLRLYVYVMGSSTSASQTCTYIRGTANMLGASALPNNELTNHVGTWNQQGSAAQVWLRLMKRRRRRSRGMTEQCGWRWSNNRQMAKTQTREETEGEVLGRVEVAVLVEVAAVQQCWTAFTFIMQQSFYPEWFT